jgi:hypothetical protein
MANKHPKSPPPVPRHHESIGVTAPISQQMPEDNPELLELLDFSIESLLPQEFDDIIDDIDDADAADNVDVNDSYSLKTPTVPAPIDPNAPPDQASTDPDITNPSLRTELLALKERHAAKVVKRNRVILASAVTLFMIFGVSYAIWRISSVTPKATIQAEPVVAPQPEPVSDRASLPPEPPRPVKVAPDEPETINIRFLGLPEGVTVLLNQQPVSVPIQTTKSTTPHYLEIVKGQKRLFSTTLVPDQDMLITLPKQVSSKKKHHPGADTPSVFEPEKKEPTKTSTGDLSSNPFPLKKNPFSIGE